MAAMTSYFILPFSPGSHSFVFSVSNSSGLVCQHNVVYNVSNTGAMSGTGVRRRLAASIRDVINNVMWTLLFFDFIFWIGFALCGYYLIIIALEFTPFLKSFDDYKYISAFVFGIISEHALPLLIESLFSFFRKKQMKLKIRFE